MNGALRRWENLYAQIREVVEQGKRFFQMFQFVGMMDGYMDAWAGCI
jgi:hypothetical protein